jgi:hypothetical protein
MYVFMFVFSASQIMITYCWSRSPVYTLSWSYTTLDSIHVLLSHWILGSIFSVLGSPYYYTFAFLICGNYGLTDIYYHIQVVSSYKRMEYLNRNLPRPWPNLQLFKTICRSSLLKSSTPSQIKSHDRPRWIDSSHMHWHILINTRWLTINLSAYVKFVDQ